MREQGIAKVRQVADAASAEVRRAAAAFERLTGQAAELGPHVRMAQALATSDPAAWQAVEPESWAALLMHLLRWAEARAVAMLGIEPPEAVLGRLEEQVRYPHTNGPLRLTLPQLVGWLQAGLLGAPLRGVAALLAPSTTNGAHLRG